jgi:geranylgeranyl diphosphate synthase type II
MENLSFERWRQPFEEALRLDSVAQHLPSSLYEPIDYFMNLGGKRLRPIVCLASAEACGTDFHKAMGAALAIEWFHNFSLVHDDIMDKAPLRRGQPTLHERNGLSAGVLCGDRMLVEAYMHLAKSPEPAIKILLNRFNQTAAEVCEGQQLDMDFECREHVFPQEYIEMIRLKTAVLLGFSLEAGALCAGWSQNQAEPLYRFGEQLGIAFQLKDDWLDAFGDPSMTGKQPGGDVRSRKKTWLWIQTHQEKPQELKSFDTLSDNERVTATLTLFQQLKLQEKSMQLALNHKNNAIQALNELNLQPKEKLFFQHFADFLLGRDY